MSGHDRRDARADDATTGPDEHAPGREKTRPPLDLHPRHHEASPPASPRHRSEPQEGPTALPDAPGPPGALVGLTSRQRAAADATRRAAVPWAGSTLVLGDGCLLLGGAAVHDVAHALRLAARFARRDGIALPGRWRTLAAAVEAAAAQAMPGTAVVPRTASTAPSSVDEIGSTEAAELLGCGRRNVRSLAERGVLTSGRVVAGRLVLDRAEVLALVAHREQNSTTTEHHRAA